MALSFNGTTDRINYTNVTNPAGAALSIACWVKSVVATGELPNRIWIVNRSGNTAQATAFSLQSSDGTLANMYLRFIRPGTVSTSLNSVVGVVNTTAWVHLVATSTASMLYADCHMYKDGVELTYGAGSNGSGEYSGVGLWAVGGQTYDDLRNLTGTLAEIGYWNRVITAGEIRALAHGATPRMFPSGLLWAPSLVRSAQDPITGQAGTLDGTTVAAHPPVLYPHRRRWWSVPVAAAAALRWPVIGSGIVGGKPTSPIGGAR
jgi:hypothetical protein